MLPTRPVALAVLAGAAALLAAWHPGASAQTVYRIVGPDGRVTFTDRPPPDPGRATTAPVVGGGAAAAGDPIAALPFELRSVAGRYPVTLYSGSDCQPCVAGRNYLVSRGIPFSERTINSNDDIEALKRLSGATSLPFLTIGGQQIKGFSPIEWGQFLDAAGYPRSSQLPPSWRPEPAAPLVAVQQPPARNQGSARRPAAPVQAEPEDQPDPAVTNPAGIRF